MYMGQMGRGDLVHGFPFRYASACETATASFQPLWQHPARGTATQSASARQARSCALTPPSPPLAPSRALAVSAGAAAAGTLEGAGDVGACTAGSAALLAAGAAPTLASGAVVPGGCEVCAQAVASSATSPHALVDRRISRMRRI